MSKGGRKLKRSPFVDDRIKTIYPQLSEQELIDLTAKMSRLEQVDQVVQDRVKARFHSLSDEELFYIKVQLLRSEQENTLDMGRRDILNYMLGEINWPYYMVKPWSEQDKIEAEKSSRKYNDGELNQYFLDVILPNMSQSPMVGDEVEASTEISEKIASLTDAFRRHNSSEKFVTDNLSKILHELFTRNSGNIFEQNKLHVPQIAPELYAFRSDQSEKPVEFIRRVYSSWIGHGLNQPLLRRLDRQLYTALHNWLRTNALPADLNLPTKSETVTAEIERVGEEGIRTAQRLSRSALNRR